MKNSFWNTFWACLLAIVASSVVFTILSVMMFAGMMAVAFASDDPVQVKANSVLKIDLSENIVDNPSQNLFGAIDPFSMNVSRSLSLIDVLNTIEKAAGDDKIEGIYLNMANLSMGMGTMEEIRNALLKFKESGKFIVSYANYYSQGTYYLASTADKVYVNPEGALDWRGMASTVMFFKGTLDKLGVKAEIFRVGEFKSAVEPFMTDRMSPENREQMEVLLNSIWGNMVEEIAESREQKTEDLQAYASGLAVVNPAKAMELGMLDGMKYNDEVLAELAERVHYDSDEETTFIELSDYMKASKGKSERRLSKNKVALVYAEGDIVDGSTPDGAVAGDALAKKLAKVRKNDDIKAVVLRVNSPGGSALASEVIWREMTLLQKEKPVIVSMGNYAASGGYYISAPADAIIADKHTLTGSIGVFGLMMNVGDMFRNKLGITTDVAKTNPSGDLGNAFRTMSPAERAFIQKSVEDVYDTFVGHVADGRNLSREEVLKIAGGRVWSGINASEIGLIDGFGGIKDAIALAADRAGVQDDYRVVTPHEPKDQLTQLLNSLLVKVKQPSISDAEMMVLEEYRSVMRMMEHEGVQARMPYVLQIQ